MDVHAKKTKMMQRRVTTLLSALLVLWLPFFGFAGDEKPGSQPTTKQTDVFKIDPSAFRLALSKQARVNIYPPFTITNNHRCSQVQIDTAQQKKTELKSQILEKYPEKSNRAENSFFTATLVSFTALNIADYLTTIKALQIPGLEEGNPVLRPFTKNIYLFTAVKVGMTALDFYILKSVHRKNKTLGWVLSIGSNLAMSYILAHNLRKIQSTPGE